MVGSLQGSSITAVFGRIWLQVSFHSIEERPGVCTGGWRAGRLPVVKETLYSALLEIVKTRRSIHRFKPEPLRDELLDKLLEVARWAPSGMNLQPWEFVIVKEPDLKASIVQLVEADYQVSRQMEQSRDPLYRSAQKDFYAGSEKYDYKQAPVFILVFGDTRTLPGLPLVVQYTQQRVRYTFQASLSNALLYLHLAAATLGLASRWISAVQSPLAAHGIKDLLGLPEFLEVLDMMAVGYPALEPKPKLMRKKQQMIHYGRSKPAEFRTDREVETYIRKARSWSSATHSRSAESRFLGADL
jgi:5,6-dimethylbenzimidazole synthase